MWISPKMLHSPVWCHLLILSFLTFPWSSDSMTLCINRTLYFMCYNTVYVHVRTLSTCAVGMVIIIVDAGHRRLLRSLAELSMDKADDSGFLSTRRVWLAMHNIDPTRRLAHH